jgi:hypothetical protein
LKKYLKAYYAIENIRRSSSHPTLEASTYRPIYNNTPMIDGSDIHARDYSIMGSCIQIGLKQENYGILLNYSKTLAFPKVVNAVSRYVEA